MVSINNSWALNLCLCAAAASPPISNCNQFLPRTTRPEIKLYINRPVYIHNGVWSHFQKFLCILRIPIFMNCIFKFILETKMVIKLTVTSHFFFSKNLHFAFLGYMYFPRISYLILFESNLSRLLPESELQIKVVQSYLIIL